MGYFMFLYSIYAIMNYLEKWKQIYPQLAFINVFFQSTLTVALFIGVYNNYEDILKFIGL